MGSWTPGPGATAGDDVFLGDGTDEVAAGGAGDDVLDGAGGNDTLDGGDGNDTLSDLAGDTATIDGGEGDDVITIGGGLLAGLIRGGAGSDQLTAGGNLSGLTLLEIETLNTNGGLVTATAEQFEGFERIRRSAAQQGDTVSLALAAAGTLDLSDELAGRRVLFTGSAGDDVLTMSAGSDMIDGGAGADRMTGGAGNDVYVVDTAGDVVVETENNGFDRVDASVSYTLSEHVEGLILLGAANINGAGNYGANTLIGNSGNNSLYGGSGNDQLFGYDGNDRLDGANGDDLMKGGLGDDIYVVNTSGDVVSEEANAGTDRVDTSISYVLGLHLENLVLLGTGNINGTGNSLANAMAGNSGDNSLSGGAGNDMLYGNAGNDRLDGGDGDDVLKGGAGDDVYVVNAAGDVVVEGLNEGTDRVEAGIGYALGNHLENLTLLGAANLDASGNFLANVITGNAGDNRIYGGSGNDTLSGEGGNDRLDGAAGDDAMAGGIGNDIYVVDSAGDTVTEDVSAGTDRVDAYVNYTLVDNVENLVLQGGANINGAGNALDNIIYGNAGNNIISGGVGNDRIISGAGVDQLSGGEGNDILEASGVSLMDGGTGTDIYVVRAAGTQITEAFNAGEIDRVDSYISFTLPQFSAGDAYVENLTLMGTANINGSGNFLDNVIIGNSGANDLFGGNGNDTLIGGAGADKLDGLNGTGIDILDGGAGNDVIWAGNDDIVVFSASLADMGVDSIQFAESRLNFQLDVDVFTGLGLGQLNADAFVNGDTALDASDRILFDGTHLYYDADGAGGEGPVLLATFGTSIVLTADNFFGI